MTTNISLIKKMFRYKISSACFLTGIVVSFLALYFGVANQRELSLAMEEISRYQYEYSCDFIVSFRDISQMLFPDYGQGNCIIKNFEVSVDDANGVILSDIIVYANEEIHMPLESGAWPSKEQLSSDERLAVLGKKRKKNVITENGKDYIYISGQKYYVCGYLSGSISTEFDSYVVLFYDALGENVRSQMATAEGSVQIFVSLLSNSYDVNLLHDSFAEEIRSCGLVEEMYGSTDYESMVGIHSNAGYFWIFAYSLIILTLVSNFWLRERKKELSIRKAFGYKASQLVKLLLWDFSLLLIFGMAAAVLLAMLIQRFLLEGIINLEGSLKNILMSVGVSLLIPVVSIIIPMLFINKEMPVNDIGKKEV